MNIFNFPISLVLLTSVPNIRLISLMYIQLQTLFAVKQRKQKLLTVYLDLPDLCVHI
jgi:hypothetical protein